MGREPTQLAAVAAAALSVPERVLLFCLASGTSWQKAGVTERTISVMVVKGMIDRDALGHPSITKQGRDCARRAAGESVGELSPSVRRFQPRSRAGKRCG